MWLRIDKKRTAAHKVYDLETITLAELRFGPTVARHDVMVQLYCHAVRLHPEDGNQASYCQYTVAMLGSVVSLIPIDV